MLSLKLLQDIDDVLNQLIGEGLTPGAGPAGAHAAQAASRRHDLGPKPGRGDNPRAAGN